MPIPIEIGSLDDTGALRVVSREEAVQPTHVNTGFTFDATGALVVEEAA